MDQALQNALSAARTYPEYRQFLQEQLDQGLTTGPNQGDYYLEIAQLNQKRMDRLDKKNRLTDEFMELLGGVQRKYLMLVLSEGWCGDAAQTLPMFNWIAESSPNIELKVVLRDEHTDLMDQYLTDGGRSIPKVLFIDMDTNEVLADWGPRPLIAQAISLRYKRSPEPKKPYAEHHIDLHGWYARDKTRSTQAELISLFAWLESEKVEK
ncbi:MAG: thioredoxin family protein [Saprospiraceae bacterium]